MEHDTDLTSLLESIGSCRVADEPFADAYAKLPLRRRGQLKSLIAWHAERHGLGGPATRREGRYDRQGGLLSLGQVRPCELALVMLAPGFGAPSRLLAAIMPALCASVGRVVVISLVRDPAIRVHASESFPVPDTLLAALELAGVEDVYVLGLDEAEQLAGAVTARRDVRMLYLPRAGGDAEPFPFARGNAEPDWTGSVNGPAGLWAGGGDGWDLEGLAYFHPDLEVRLWGPEPLALDFPESLSMTITRGGEEDFLAEEGRSILFAPSSLAGRCLGRAPLTAGPGREWFWSWPGLDVSMFGDHSEAVFTPVAPDMDEEERDQESVEGDAAHLELS